MSTELIAELSTNWGGDAACLRDIIFRAKDAGADFVKTQSYQVRTLRPGDPQTAWLTQCEMSDDLHWQVKEWAQQAGVKWLTTVFHISRVPFLKSLGLEAIKIGAGECREDALVRRCGDLWPNATYVSAPPDYGIPALDVFWLGIRYVRCVGRYPSPLEFSRRWAASRYVLDPPSYVSEQAAWIGWSDHCVSLLACQDAIMSGAQYIECHVQWPEQKRPAQAWEKTLAEIKHLRKFVDDGPHKWEGRWQHNG